MRINNNLMAMNTHRQLGIASNGGAKSMEKLSSGFRINRAGDDAAGLAISEKMRGQIRGLTQASRNAQDGISLIQTAEGALNETHAILQRMRELAVQSATDTNTQDDRAKIQSEVDQLAEEITRISNTTEFNTRNLLAGGLNTTFHVGANEGQNVQNAIGSMDAFSLGVAGKLVAQGAFTAGTSGITGASNMGSGLTDGTYTINTTKVAADNGTLTKVGGLEGGEGTFTGTYTGDANTTLNIRITGQAAGAVTEFQYQVGNGNWTTVTGASGAIAGTGLTWTSSGTYTDDDVANNSSRSITTTLTAAQFSAQLEDGDGNAVGSAVEFRSSATSVTVGNTETGETMKLSFTAGAITDAGAATQVVTTVGSSKAILDGSGNVVNKAEVVKGVDVSSQYAADKAITTVNNALEKVSAERSKLGASQNRLEHTIKNLDTSAENLQASEARIRDVDMAKEMMEQTKQNILQQASTAMLAQANTAPQTVLQLLR